MKLFFYFFFMLVIFISSLQAVIADELLELHKVTTTEMNNINVPQAGSVVFNTTEHTLYFYTGSIWKRLRSTGTETIVNAGSGMTVTGNGSNTSPYTLGVN